MIHVKCAVLTLASFFLSTKAPSAAMVLENTPNREAVTLGIEYVTNKHNGKDWGPRPELLLFFSSLIDLSMWSFRQPWDSKWPMGPFLALNPIPLRKGMRGGGKAASRSWGWWWGWSLELVSVGFLGSQWWENIQDYSPAHLLLVSTNWCLSLQEQLLYWLFNIIVLALHVLEYVIEQNPSSLYSVPKGDTSDPESSQERKGPL